MSNINVTLATTVADLIAAVQPSLVVGTAPPPVTVNAPAPVASGVQVNPQLAAYVAANPSASWMVEVNPTVPPGWAGTVTLPQTGHVLSVPHPEIGETLIGYFERTSVQTGIGLAMAQQVLGAVQQLQSGLYSFGPTSASWPAMADELAWRLMGIAGANPYAPAATGGTAPAPQPIVSTGSIPWGSLTDGDRAYAIKTFKTRAGTNVPVAIAAAFSGADQWSIWEGDNEAMVANFDLSTYTGPLLGKL